VALSNAAESAAGEYFSPEAVELPERSGYKSR
jgi:hypothetical protein